MSTHPDNWDERPEPVHELAPESSLPLDGLKEKTKGFRPRTRTANTREASMRSQKYIDYYTNSAIESHKGKTHMPPELIPEGYVFMWARESTRGRPDHNNLMELQNKHGWEFASADQIPSKAYFDDHGNVDDSSGRVRIPGLVGMIRRKEIHEAQLRFFEKMRDSQRRMQAQMRSRDGDLHPFSNQGSLRNNNSFFPSDEISRSFANTFSY